MRTRIPESAGGTPSVPAGAEGLPDWIDRIDVAAWVSGPDGRIAHVNDRACELLQRPRGAMLGRPCHDVIGGTTSTGEPHCRPHCPLTVQAERRVPLRPVTVAVDIAGEKRWLNFLVIPIELPGREGTWLAHCATPLERARRAEAYLESVAARRSATAESPERLTPRQREVLGLLARGIAPEAVARELHVSLVTVRNHVQHLLAKLGAHSIQEAVAVYLLGPETAPSTLPSASEGSASADASAAPPRPARRSARASRRPAS